MHVFDSVSHVLESPVWSALRTPRFNMQYNIIAPCGVDPWTLFAVQLRSLLSHFDSTFTPYSFHDPGQIKLSQRLLR
jgi:hypothetical protein